MPEPGSGIGETVELLVEKAVHRGQGLARLGGQTVLLPGALPGERVRAKVIARERGFLRARVLDVLRPSPERRPSPCCHFPECGGCAWQELAYPGQLRLKEAVLRESLERAGARWSGDIRVQGSPEDGWRTRATLHSSLVEGRLRAGLYRAASHSVVEIGSCRQLSEGLRVAVASLVASLEAAGLGPLVGDLRLAEAGDGARRALLVSLRETGPGTLERVSAALARLEAFDGIALAGRRGDPLAVRGEPIVAATVLGADLETHVASFFQANRFLLAPLVESVLAAVPEGAELLDLFAGVGLFAIAAARRRDARAVAVELSSLSARDARRNAARLVPGRVRVRQGDALAGLRSWRPRGGPGVIVVDPPRTGLDRELLRALCERGRRRIVYVSCDPPSLGRDLARFASHGWRPTHLEAFDLFPDTFHLESVVTLEASAAPM
jgi:23S rRNA (uracil1939-C5)-methyltransferase